MKSEKKNGYILNADLEQLSKRMIASLDERNKIVGGDCSGPYFVLAVGENDPKAEVLVLLIASKAGLKASEYHYSVLLIDGVACEDHSESVEFSADDMTEAALTKLLGDIWTGLVETSGEESGEKVSVPVPVEAKKGNFSVKTIGCTFTMTGAYDLAAKSVYAAWQKAMGGLPLPQDREYLSDSLVVDDLAECMLANGWDDDEVDALSRFTSETLIAEIDRRRKLGIEKDGEWEFTATRLKEFLLDYYGVDYDEIQKADADTVSTEEGQENYAFVTDPASLSKMLIADMRNYVPGLNQLRFSQYKVFAKGKKDPTLEVSVSILEEDLDGKPAYYNVTTVDQVSGGNTFFFKTSEATETALAKTLSGIKEMLLEKTTLFAGDPVFAYLKEYVASTCFDEEGTVKGLHALWIAFCLHRSLTVGMFNYTAALNELWNTMGERGDNECSYWGSFSEFVYNMSQNLR